MSGRRQDERGAVAIMVAVMATLLMVFAALAVDLGNLIARKTWTQAQADHAALAGGSELLSTAPAGGTPPAAVVNAVAEFLNANAPQQDDSACWRATPVNCVAAADLTDGDPVDGEVEFTSLGLRVTAPEAWVDFGLGGVMGIDGADVSADATVQIKSGGLRVMPMFAVDACGWGRQTLIDPANNPAPVPPVLYANTETNNTTLVSGSVTLRTSAGITVSELTPGSTGNTVSFSGKKFDNTKKVGFFHSDGTHTLGEEQEVIWNDDGTTTPDISDGAGNLTNVGTKAVRVAIPDVVTAKEGVWWIRVWNAGTQNQWSAASQALAIRVGGAVLECTSTPNQGNFGTLRIPRTTPNQPAEHIPANIALGWQKPITPALHTTVSADGRCKHGYLGAVVSYGTYLRPGTNCVGTDPGVATQDLNTGLVKGGAGYTGLLRTKSTKAGCAPDRGSSDRTVNMQGSYTINDEVLTCYLTNTTTSLAEITSPTYAGGPVLDKSIYDSPRFFYVPILSQDPGTGAQAQDEGHSIIDFRPAFLTNETATTTSTAPPAASTATTDNGLKIENNGIVQMRVVLFNFNALPTDADTVMDYLGVGPRILRMVD